MTTPRISASSYSNTAPLIWSFLYGRERGRVELVLDNAPARSAELLAQDRVDAALVPVIAYQTLANVILVPDVCVGARQTVRSVCLVTKGSELANVRTVALDRSSRTSVILTKVIFREFLGFEPDWTDAAANVDLMLAHADAAMIIGDPALALSSGKAASKTMNHACPPDGVVATPDYRIFDLAELWHEYTGLGFVFAMWMTRQDRVDIDLAAARDEGLAHVDEIIANYADLGVDQAQMRQYLCENISYTVDEQMKKGMELYFRLAASSRLTEQNRSLAFI